MNVGNPFEKGHKERIELTDTLPDILMKMSEGNPGAVNTMMAMITEGKRIDPDSALGEFSGLLSLDSIGIYGSDIYILWNDICKNDIGKTLAMLRAVQLGFFNGEILKDACHRQDRSGVELVPVDELYAKVKEKLPDFDKK